MPRATLELALSRRRNKPRAMNGGVIREQQIIADRFFALGLLPRAINIRDAVWQTRAQSQPVLV
ncbi:hypothetical protein [Affinibrenneria salicis]|uniref:hypothetical protein n=1 Tax=Affinibrenneria salicis TaxID=2590031 RepID=UPI001CC79FA0|nr:hypothetical protein [Affinibrenneria salicis]